jgi:transposase
VQYGPSVIARALYLHQYQLLPYRRTSEAMRELFSCALSPGTLARSVADSARGLVQTELKIKRRLRGAGVIHVDETGLRVAEKCHYVHVASTARLTHYGYDAGRGRAAMDEIDILPRFRGTCVHDGWLSYTYYRKCQHALCGAHLLRELTYFAELDEQRKVWAEPLRQLLLEIKREVDGAREGGGDWLDSERVTALTSCYEHLVKDGLEANPPAHAADQVGRQARNLVLRLERRKEEVLRFMRDFAVPFDNNQAERDLRMIKLRQKISGGFRTGEGARQFCRIRNYLSTMSKQDRGALLALERACAGRPFSPTS